MGGSQLAFLLPHSHLRGLQLGCPVGRSTLPGPITPRAELLRERSERWPEGVTCPRSQNQHAAVVGLKSSFLCSFALDLLSCMSHSPSPPSLCLLLQMQTQSKDPTSSFLPKSCPVRQPEIVPTGPGYGGGQLVVKG